MPSFRVVFSSGSVCLLGLSGYLYFSGNPWFYQRVVMPAVTRMDPEKAHLAAVWAAARGLTPRDHSRDPASLVGSAGGWKSTCRFKTLLSNLRHERQDSIHSAACCSDSCFNSLAFAFLSAQVLPATLPDMGRRGLQVVSQTIPFTLTSHTLQLVRIACWCY